ncbi:MAG TPA: long-chain fatty acid--CoA ligase [Desulfobulbus sp.]|nr:long-chain fatty acid--CoA ligase [Desulfobulbus sp.]
MEQSVHRHARAGSANLPVVHRDATTLNELIDNSCRRYGDLPALGMALEKPLTYRVLHGQILSLARLLRRYGVGHGSRVAILAENSHRWGLVYLAVVRLGGIAVPILPDLPEADVHHILGEMECQALFLSQRQAEKVYDLEKRPPLLVSLDDFRDETGILELRPFSSLLAEAGETGGGKEDEDPFPEVAGNDLASILYTSGTSGFSKAVMLSHANLCANACCTARIIDLEPGSVFLSVLPISHTYEFTVGFILPLLKGCCVFYAGKAPTPAVLQKVCARQRPHAMLVVPLILEKIYKKRVLPAIEKSRALSFCCRFRMGRRMVFRRIGRRLLEFFGGRLWIMGIGGASLNPEVERFLRDAGFPFIVGYGLTECAPLIAAGPPGDPSVVHGSTGRPIPGVEVRIHEPDPETGIGEIQVRGPNVMQGYWGDPEATDQTFTEDGWLRTGDLGLLDGHGNLHIRGRSKSVIVMANGENIYPEAIEHRLNSYPFVLESLVVENRGMLEAWVYPDYDFIDAETKGQSRQQRYAHVSSLLDRMRVEVNGQLASSSRLSRVLERREPFIKTATHKIKRYLYSADAMP